MKFRGADRNRVPSQGKSTNPKIFGFCYADQLAEFTKGSLTTQQNKATGQIFVKKPLLVPVLSFSHKNQKRKTLNRKCAALEQRRRKIRLHDEREREILFGTIGMNLWEAEPIGSWSAWNSILASALFSLQGMLSGSGTDVAVYTWIGFVAPDAVVSSRHGLCWDECMCVRLLEARRRRYISKADFVDHWKIQTGTWGSFGGEKST